MSETQFGSSKEDLATRSTVYAGDLFAGKTVVVTGAGGGLGLAIAALFAKLGAKLGAEQNAKQGAKQSTTQGAK